MKAKFNFFLGYFSALMLFAFFAVLTGVETEKAVPIIVFMIIIGIFIFAYVYIKHIMDESLK